MTLFAIWGDQEVANAMEHKRNATPDKFLLYFFVAMFETCVCELGALEPEGLSSNE